MGSTGSIGIQTLDVAERLGLKIAALAADKNTAVIENQARKFHPSMISMTDEKAARELKESLKDTDIKVVSGREGLCEAARQKEAGLVVNAVVGVAGLEPTLAAIAAKKDIALANKETLVTGGSLVTASAAENGVALLPVDSEHSAIFQCLRCGSREKGELKKILLTASGGPFFGYTPEKLKKVTLEQALCHPNWKMGRKITVDSATLMNKGLELIEAVWLFGVPPEKIEVLVQRESVIHSMVEFADNSVIAQLGVPDMRGPIQYALTFPDRVESPAAEPDFFKIKTLSFAKPDEKTFPCLSLCREAIKAGGLLPVAVNAANEAAVGFFLQSKIGFADIAEIVAQATESRKNTNKPLTLKDILNTDAEVRESVEELVSGRC